MFKAGWWDWFLITLNKHTKYLVMQNSLVLKQPAIIIDTFTKWFSNKQFF